MLDYHEVAIRLNSTMMMYSMCKNRLSQHQQNGPGIYESVSTKVFMS